MCATCTAEAGASWGLAALEINGAGGGNRVGMIERLQHQLAAAALGRVGAERVAAVEHAGDQPVVVDAEPTAAGDAMAADSLRCVIRA